MAATGHLGDSLLVLLDYLLRVARVAVLLALWRMLLAGQGTVSGLTLGAVLTYTLIAEVFAEQVTPRTELAEGLWQGTLATRFLQPLSIVGQLAAEMVGRWGLGFLLCSLPLLLAAPLLGVDPRPASPAAGLLFVPSLALAVSVGLALEFIFGALTVAVEQNIWLIDRIRGVATALLSGALIPLALLPWDLGAALAWLPFAAMASTPLRIYTGTGEAGSLMLLQAGWSLALWPVAGWLWGVYRERLAFYGG